MQIFEVDEKMTKLTWQTTVSDNNKFEEIEEDCQSFDIQSHPTVIKICNISQA